MTVPCKVCGGDISFIKGYWTLWTPATPFNATCWMEGHRPDFSPGVVAQIVAELGDIEAACQ